MQRIISVSSLLLWLRKLIPVTQAVPWGGADFVNVLFSEFLVYDPENPAWEGRDRFFLDPGHMSPMLYSQLALAGKFTLDELKEFRQWDSPTPGHPERDIMRGIENTSGPLGQGHTFCSGCSYRS